MGSVFLHTLPLWFQERVTHFFRYSPVVLKQIENRKAEINLITSPFMIYFILTEAEKIELLPYILGAENGSH